MKTMIHRLTIEFGGQEGAFLRILGLMERRGYHLHSCKMNRRKDNTCSVDIKVESERRGDLLQRQLERLHDVDRVRMKSPEQQPASVRRINMRARA